MRDEERHMRTVLEFEGERHELKRVPTPGDKLEEAQGTMHIPLSDDEIVYHGDGFCRSCTEGRINKLKQRCDAFLSGVAPKEILDALSGLYGATDIADKAWDQQDAWQNLDDARRESERVLKKYGRRKYSIADR